MFVFVNVSRAFSALYAFIQTQQPKVVSFGFSGKKQIMSLHDVVELKNNYVFITQIVEFYFSLLATVRPDL